MCVHDQVPCVGVIKHSLQSGLTSPNICCGMTLDFTSADPDASCW